MAVLRRVGVAATTFILLAACQNKQEKKATSSRPETQARPRAVRETARPAPARRQAPAPRQTAVQPQTKGPHPRVVIQTNMGKIVVELYPDKAPITVANFLRYVKEKFYDGTIFHRVVPGFVIQGGGFTRDLRRKPTHEPIKNEADNGLKNLRGTIAMARTRAIDSATSQFYINLKDNPGLDHRGPDPRRYGYAVFGKVVEGMDVVDKIAQVPTGACGPLPKSCPQKPVVIESIRIVASVPAQGPQPSRAPGGKVQARVQARITTPPRTRPARTRGGK